MGTIRVFNHYLKVPILILGAVEAAVLVVSVYVGALVRFDGQTPQMMASVGPLWPKALVIAIAVVATMIATGLYQRHLREGPLGIVRRLIVSFVLAVVAMSLVFYLLPQLYLGRGAFVIACSIGFVGLMACRLIYFQLLNRSGLKRRVLILGTGKRAAALTSLRRKSDRLGLELIGYVRAGDIDPAIDESQVIELDEPLCDYASREEIDEVVVALDDRRNTLPINELLECRIRGMEITDLLSFFERETGKVKVDLMYPSWLTYSHGFFYRASLRQFTKRFFDLVVSAFLLLLTSPFMLLAAMAIVAESGRPVFYRQRRVGEHGRMFEAYKFRSMVQDAERAGVQWTSHEDPRITRVGELLRRYRIDELPQLFNVLKGDMSLVGPRPERPEFVDVLRDELPYYAERQRVKPGLTGWAQICYPYGASKTDALEKLQFDLYYIKNYSIFLDMSILLHTTEVILWSKGSR